MAIVKNISYHTIQTDHSDQAESLAYYLNEHGVCANATADTIDVPVPDTATFDKVEALKTTWSWFWDTSDSGLFGLPLYVKE